MRWTLIPIALLCCLELACGEDAETGTDDGDVAVSDADAGTSGDAVDFDRFEAIDVRFTVEGTGLYRLPWPLDYRLGDDGTVDLAEFPREGVELFEKYIDALDGLVAGFSIMPVVYIGLEGDPTADAAPEPHLSLTADGPVQLINVSAEGCGRRTPVEMRVNHEVDHFIEDNVLMAAPVVGFVLDPLTPYALVVLRTLGNEAGFTLARPDEFAAVLEGTHADEAMNDAYGPLRDCLPVTGIDPEHIAVATVFTTQDPVSEMRALRDFVADPANVATATISDWRYDDNHSRAGHSTYLGTYQTPIFQDGVSPYATEGGMIHFEGGVPVVQGEETVPFAVSFPTRSDGPLELLIWVDGTGAGQTSWVNSAVTRAMRDADFAVASYVAQFHDTRATLGANEELHSFNFFNPVSFRNTFRQQVADTAYFLRVMREARDQMPDLPEIDDAIVVYGGQSQGSLIGAMVAGVEPDIDAYMLNGVGGYLSATAVGRTDPIDIRALAADVADISPDFDRFHPLMALLQLGGDATDPHSFARAWVGWDENPDGVDMLLVNGVDDHTTPIDSMNSLTIAGGVAPVQPPGWSPDPFGVGEVGPELMPITGNRETLDGGSRTHAAFMSGTTGHFTIYDRADARSIAINFLQSAANGDAVVE